MLLGGYLLLTSTVRLNTTLWQYDVKRILELCLLPLIFAAVLLDGSLRSSFRQQLGRIPPWMLGVLSVILGLGVLSSAHNSTSAMSLVYSLAEVSLFSLLILAALCVAACRQVAGAIFDQAAILLLALVALAVGLQELLGVLAAWNSGMEFIPRIALLHFSWPRFYNQVQTWSIPVIAALPLVFPGKPLAKALCVTALALESYVLLASGGRGSMVAVSLALLTAMIMLPSIRKPLTLYSLTGLLGGLLIYSLVAVSQQNLPRDDLASLTKAERPAPAEKAEARTAPDGAAQKTPGARVKHFTEPMSSRRMWSASGRLAIWRDALHDAQSHPLLGIGPMNYACIGPLNRAAHPHNFPLQFASEWGVSAVLLLLLVAAYLSARTTAIFAHRRKTGDSWAHV